MRRNTRRRRYGACLTAVCSILLVTFLLVAGIPPARAATPPTGPDGQTTVPAGDALRADGLPSSARSILVPRGENVDAVLAIGRDVRVGGTVTNSIVAVAGNVTLEPGARAQFVLDIGGRVRQAHGSSVSEAVIAIGTQSPVLMLLALSGLTSLGGYLAMASVTAVLFLILLAGGLLLYPRDAGVSEYLSRHPLRCLATGAWVTLIPVAVTLAAALTPAIWMLAGLFWLTYLLIGIVGLILLGNRLGRSVEGGWTPGRPLPAPLYGAIAYTLLTSIPVVGPLAAVACWLLGQGAVLSALLRPRRQDSPQAPK